VSYQFATPTSETLKGTMTAFSASSWTIGGWFYPVTAGGSNIGTMIAIENGATQQQFLRFSNGSLTVNAQCAHSTSAATSTSNSVAVANAWNCLIATYNSSDKKVRLFFNTGVGGAMQEDGSYNVQTAGSGTMTTGATTAQIGDRQLSGFDFDGKIGSVFAVNRLLSVDQMEMFRTGDWSALWDGTTVPSFYLPLNSANNAQDIANQITFTVTGPTYSSENPPTSQGGGVLTGVI
jgi:hypothetical protein